MPEGTLAFPGEPLVRVTAPIIEAQIMETYLLATVSFQTMIASKAARVVTAAQGARWSNSARGVRTAARPAFSPRERRRSAAAWELRTYSPGSNSE